MLESMAPTKLLATLAGMYAKQPAHQHGAGFRADHLRLQSVIQEAIDADADAAPVDAHGGIEAMWAAARTLRELLALNIDFVEGRVGGTPYHLGPMVGDADMGDIVDLHRLGVLTIEGQGGLRVAGEWVPKTWTLRDGTKQGQWFADEQQKAYLTFFIPRAKEAALDLLKAKTVWFQTDISTGAMSTNCDKDRYTVTRGRSAKRKEDLPTIKWTADTTLVAVPDPVGTQFPALPNVRAILNGADLLFVSAAAKTYGPEEPAPEHWLLRGLRSRK